MINQVRILMIIVSSWVVVWRELYIQTTTFQLEITGVSYLCEHSETFTNETCDNIWKRRGGKKLHREEIALKTSHHKHNTGERERENMLKRQESDIYWRREIKHMRSYWRFVSLSAEREWQVNDIQYQSHCFTFHLHFKYTCELLNWIKH